MRSKSSTTGDTTFDRRQLSAHDATASGQHERTRRRADRPAARASASRVDEADLADVLPRKRRATRDGRQPLVVYLRPEVIKAVKIAALEHDTTASAIVAHAVSSWLRARSKRNKR